MVAALSVTAGVAHADPAQEIKVAARALGFLERSASGPMVVGVVFDPSKPGSVADKNELMGVIGGGFNAGAVTLVGKPVEVNAIASAAGVNILFLTDGVNYGAAGAAAKSRRLVTVGSSTCANSGACVLGVATAPKVEITLNRAAAAAVGAAFKAAFRMMIKEI